MNKSVTKPRPEKGKPVVIAVAEEEVQITPALGTALPPAAPEPVLHAPQGAPAVEEQPQVLESQPESTPAPVLAEEVNNAAPVVVPAPLTVAQQAAAEMRTAFDASWSMFYGKRPVATSAGFTEPTKEDLKTRRTALAVERGIDLTDVDALIELGIEIKGLVDAERDAYAAAAANQSLVDREWLNASRVQIAEVLANVDQLIVNAGGKIQTRKISTAPAAADGEKKERSSSGRSGINWKERAPKLLAWADKLGLEALYFRDKSESGYKGIMHMLKLHTDGRWEIVDPITRKGTGEMVDAPLYYNKDGMSIAKFGGEVPNVGGPMRAFVIPTIGKDGKEFMTPLNASVGASATAKHFYILPDDAWDAAQ